MSGIATYEPPGQRTQFDSSSAYNCQCGRDKRSNAILCRACWFLLPLAMRERLPFRASHPRYTQVRDACLEWIRLAVPHFTRPSRERSVIEADRQRRRERQSEIEKSVVALPVPREEAA